MLVLEEVSLKVMVEQREGWGNVVEQREGWGNVVESGEGWRCGGARGVLERDAEGCGGARGGLAGWWSQGRAGGCRGARGGLGRCGGARGGGEPGEGWGCEVGEPGEGCWEVWWSQGRAGEMRWSQESAREGWGGM